MCGVAGFLDLAGEPLDVDASHRVGAAMLARIRHRGPDEAGCAVDGPIAIGAVRLAILDLANGQQPMVDASGRYVIAYNGETYNFRELRAELEGVGRRFRTTSDTEVVLEAFAAWGSAAIPRLNGAFAFAIWDRRERTLTLARDRYGERPLFYAEVGGRLVFASEVKALLDYPGAELALDPRALATIFTVWTPLPDQTAFASVRAIPPGSSLEVRGGRLELRAYAGIDDAAPPFSGTAEEAIEALRALLADAVCIRLRSDVEVATYLSGGLDSAVTTHLALANGLSRAHSFSITFEDAEFDESTDQQEVARHLGTSHTALAVRRGDIARAFPDAVWHAEVPVFRTALVPMFLLSRRVHDAGIKVVLTGEGSDEAFLGYDLFKEALLRSTWGAARDPAALAALYPYLPHFTAANARALAVVFDQFATEKRAGLFSHELRFHNSLFGLRLLAGAGDGLADLEAYVADSGAELAARELVGRAQWLEMKTLLAGYLLSSQGDRMSMAHAVETRCPFLDPRVVSFAATLPQALKLGPGGDEKWIVKRAFEGALPRRMIQKPKQPYRAPDAASFLVGEGAEYTELLLSDVELAKVDALDAAFCRAFVDKVRAAPPGGISQRENQAFVLLLSVALLHRQFVERRCPAETTAATPVGRVTLPAGS